MFLEIFHHVSIIRVYRLHQNWTVKWS